MPFGFTRTDDLNEQRYERLKETLEEYLGDEGNDPAELVRDLKRGSEELKAYHAERLAAFNKFEGSLEDLK